MPLVFPTDLAARSTTVALSKGAFWFGGVFISVAAVILVVISRDRDTAVALPALSGLVIIVTAAVLVRVPAARNPIVMAAAAGLALAGTALYLALLIPLIKTDAPSDTIVLTLVKVAVIMFGAVASRYTRATTATLVALVIAEVPTIVFSAVSHHPYTFDVATAVAFFVVFGVFSLLDLARRRARSSAAVLVRASREDRAAIEQDETSSSSSALVHDTILNELAVVATTPAGPLGRVARSRIAHSLELVSGPVASPEPGRASLAPALSASLLSVILDEASRSGLTLSVSGDFSVLASLAPATGEALALAIRQCLANVTLHSGVDRAELSLLTTPDDVCVLVIDAGAGFDEADVAPDRLGLRNSVRGRIEQVGGSVHVWTSRGAGTSISLLVPRV